MAGNNKVQMNRATAELVEFQTIWKGYVSEPNLSELRFSEGSARIMKLLEGIGLLHLKLVDNIYNFKKLEFSKNNSNIESGVVGSLELVHHIRDSPTQFNLHHPATTE